MDKPDKSDQDLYLFLPIPDPPNQHLPGEKSPLATRCHRGVAGGRPTSVAEQLGDAEGEVERLAAVEAGVAHRLVAVVELGVEDLLGAAEALGDVVAGQLDVDAAGPGALGRWARKKPAISARTSSKWRVLRPLGAVKVLPCIGSHAHTTGWPASRDGPQQRRQPLLDVARRPCG